MAWWNNNQGIASPNLNVTPQQRQYFAGTDWRSQMSPVNAWSNANAPSMNALNQDIGNVAANTSQANFDAGYTGDDDDVPGMGKQAIDYRDAPVNFMMRANHPTKFDPLVNAKNFAQELPGKIKSGITGILDNTMIGRIMGGLKNSFQDRTLGTSNVVDEFGRVHSSADLNEENALGGGYTDAARSSRRATQRYNNMLERKALGKKYSTINLAKMRAVLEKQRELDNRGYSGTPGGNTGSGAFARFDNTTLDYGPHKKSGGQGNQSGGDGTGSTGQGTGGMGAPGGSGYGPHSRAYGGRIGYRGGEFVDEDINVEGPGFDVNENIEMAETSPFEIRIQELMDTGMSWQEAYQIASEEFGQVVEGESDQGIASLV